MSSLIYRYATPRHSRCGFAIGAILYMLGLIGVLGGILFSNYMQVLRSNVTLQNGLMAKNDLQGASNTLSAEAVFGADNQTLCVPRSTHQTSGNNCAAAPISLIQFSDLASTTQLPANYSVASSTGSPVEVGVFAAGAGAKQLDASGHYYIYCRWENTRANPASPAFVLISAGDNGILETKCGDTAAQGDDTFIFMTVGNAINRASLWQADTSNNVSYGSAGSKVTVDSSGDLTAAGTISAANAFINNGITAATVTTSGDVSVKDLTASGNVIGSAGSFTSLSGSNLTISGAATINGTTTLQALSAQATTLDSVTVTNAATIGGGLSVNGGDLDLANGYSYAQIDSTGNARRLIALSSNNDVLLGGHNGTNYIYFLAANAEVGYFDTSANFVAFGNITGANGSFSAISGSSAAITNTLTAANVTASSTVTAATGNITTVNATTINTTNASVTGTLTVKNLSLSGTTTGTSGSFSSLAVSGNATIGGTLGVTGSTSLGVLSAGATSLNSLTVTNAIASGSLGISGNTTIGGTLGVTGTTSISVLSAGATSLNSLAVTNATTSGSLGITGNATIGGTFGVTGTTTLASVNATTAVFTGTITAPIADIGTTPSDTAAIFDAEGGTAAANANGVNIVLAAQNAGSGNKNGGNIILLPGLLSGTGSYGAVLVGETSAGTGASVAPADLEIGGKGPQLMLHSTNGCGGVIGFYAGGMGQDGWRIENSTPTCGNLGDLEFIEKGSTIRLSLKAGGNVGIGTTSPAATLDIAGFMRMTKNTAAPATCSSTNDGSIALNHSYTLCICNGGSSAWVKASDGATSCAW